MSELILFYWISGVVALIALAIPIALVPMRWAGWLLWQVPAKYEGSDDERNLSLYFGRCLGGLAIAYCFVCLYVAYTEVVPKVVMIQTILIGLSLTLVHAYGAIKKIQPVTENWEILAYGGLTVWAVRLYVLNF